MGMELKSSWKRIKHRLVENVSIESNDGFDWLTQETQHQHQFIPPESSSRFELSQGSAFASSSSSSSSVAAAALPKPKAKITIPPSFQTTPTTTARYPPTAESFKANPFEDLFNYNVQESGQQSSEPAAATVSPQHQKPQIPNPLFRQSDQGIRKDAWTTAPAQPLKQPKQPKPKPRVEPKRFSDVPKFHAPKTTTQQQQQQQQQEPYRPQPVRTQVPLQHQQQQNNNSNNSNSNKKAFYKHRYHPHEIVWIQTLLNPSTEGDNRRQLRQILKTHTQVKSILSKCLVETFYWPCVIREVLPGEYRPANIQIEGEGDDTVRIKDTSVAVDYR
ncbi:hypothetical protein BDR26DRAFT_897703 [Obelidium mucronatum]|nr:hypothetical protein BDR26DRAFT_897703 [Obelidium mucronatum]